MDPYFIRNIPDWSSLPNAFIPYQGQGNYWQSRQHPHNQLYGNNHSDGPCSRFGPLCRFFHLPNDIPCHGMVYVGYLPGTIFCSQKAAPSIRIKMCSAFKPNGYPGHISPFPSLWHIYYLRHYFINAAIEYGVTTKIFWGETNLSYRKYSLLNIYRDYFISLSTSPI